MSTHLILDLLHNTLGVHGKSEPANTQYAFNCPECAADKGLLSGDGKYNLEVNIKKGVYKCWACSETNNTHGPIEKLLKKYGTHKDLVSYRKYKPEYIPQDGEPRKVVDWENLGLPEEFIPLTMDNQNEKGFKEAYYYFTKVRGYNDKIIKRYNIGYCPTGKFRGRIIIPSYDGDEYLNYFVGRAYWTNSMSYLNCEASEKFEGVRKFDVIFNEKLINPDSTITLVEGPLDHLVVYNSVPLLGKVLHDKLFHYLYEKANGYILIMLDEDAYANSLKIYNQLNVGRLRGKVFLVPLPKDEDPSSIYKANGYKGISNLIKKRIIVKENLL